MTKKSKTRKSICALTVYMKPTQYWSSIASLSLFKKSFKSRHFLISNKRLFLRKKILCWFGRKNKACFVIYFLYTEKQELMRLSFSIKDKKKQFNKKTVANNATTFFLF